MKLVINLPNDWEELVREMSDSEIVGWLYGVCRNGTVLPKGHGRLIDADELLTSERPKGIADDVWEESHIYKLLSNAPTIIEADKEN